MRALLAYLPPSQTRALAVTSAVLSGVSATGSLFVVISLQCFAPLRQSPSSQLVMWLAVSDVLYGVFAMLLSHPADVDGAIAKDATGTALCQFQAIGTQLFSLTSFLWTVAIAHTLHGAVIKRDVNHLETWLGRYHRMIWGVSAVSAVIPLFGNDYGPTGGGFCWIKNDRAVGKVLRALCFYLPLWFSIGYNSYAMWQVTSVITRALRLAVEVEVAEDEEEDGLELGDGDGGGAEMRLRNLKSMRRLGTFPLILVGCWFFATVNRVYELFDAPPSLLLYVLQVVTSSLMGLLNALVYGMAPSVRRAWRRALGRLPVVGPLVDNTGRVPSGSDYRAFGDAPGE